MSDSEIEATENHYSCEFSSMKDPPRERKTNSSSSTRPMDELVRRLTSLSVDEASTRVEPILGSFDLQGIAKYIQEKRVRNIICMCGAGISVNAGIPDFRSPKTGLFSRLAEMGLKSPEDVFSIQLFKKDPKPFYNLAKEIMPGKFKPTKTHYFMKLLEDKKMLLRCYTQNIDSLESQAGLSIDKVVAAHGNFDSACCSKCKKEVELEKLMEHLSEAKVMKCEHCSGVIKPDIVFYGEALPQRFHQLTKVDFPKCDLLIAMGSSLVVFPFCTFVDNVEDSVPRLLINKEWASGGYGFEGSGFQQGDINIRDAFFQGDCDEGVTQLAQLLGLKKEFEKLVNQS